MNLSRLPRYETRRHITRDGNGTQSGTPEYLPSQKNLRSNRQLRRLYWILLIVSMLLLLNILITVSGFAAPVYSLFFPGSNTAGTL